MLGLNDPHLKEVKKRMSNLEEVLRKASSDTAFRSRLQTDFEGAIRPYNLSDAEKQQLRTSEGVGISKEAPVRQAAVTEAAQNAEAARAEVAQVEGMSSETLD
jgi:hypothetical protein